MPILRVSVLLHYELNTGGKSTNTNDCNHIMASKLGAADAVLKTNEQNKEMLTATAGTKSPEGADNAV